MVLAERSATLGAGQKHQRINRFGGRIFKVPTDPYNILWNINTLDTGWMGRT